MDGWVNGWVGGWERENLDVVGVNDQEKKPVVKEQYVTT